MRDSVSAFGRLSTSLPCSLSSRMSGPSLNSLRVFYLCRGVYSSRPPGVNQDCGSNDRFFSLDSRALLRRLLRLRRLGPLRRGRPLRRGGLASLRRLFQTFRDRGEDREGAQPSVVERRGGFERRVEVARGELAQHGVEVE